MNSIAIQNCSVSFSDSFLLRDISFTLELDQHWVILGPNGSGKSAIAALLAGFGELKAGSIQGLPSRVSLVSFESQRQLIERELDRDESDITDEIFEGTQVQEILLEDCVEIFIDMVEDSAVTRNTCCRVFWYYACICNCVCLRNGCKKHMNHKIYQSS